MNQIVAFSIASEVEGALTINILVYVSFVWCWIGGGLDFLYFMMKGEMPEFDTVWHWMPFRPQTWQFAIYALVWLIGLIVAWAGVLL